MAGVICSATAVELCVSLFGIVFPLNNNVCDRIRSVCVCECVRERECECVSV